MNVFIILAILIIVIGVFIMTASSSEIFKFNWNEKTFRDLGSGFVYLFFGQLTVNFRSLGERVFKPFS